MNNKYLEKIASTAFGRNLLKKFPNTSRDEISNHVWNMKDRISKSSLLTSSPIDRLVSTNKPIRNTNPSSKFSISEKPTYGRMGPKSEDKKILAQTNDGIDSKTSQKALHSYANSFNIKNETSSALDKFRLKPKA